jgi:hypothetical protein
MTSVEAEEKKKFERSFFLSLSLIYVRTNDGCLKWVNNRFLSEKEKAIQSKVILSECCWSFSKITMFAFVQFEFKQTGNCTNSMCTMINKICHRPPRLYIKSLDFFLLIELVSWTDYSLILKRKNSRRKWTRLYFKDKHMSKLFIEKRAKGIVQMCDNGSSLF